jgi:hypothetical protein
MSSGDIDSRTATTIEETGPQPEAPWWLFVHNKGGDQIAVQALTLDDAEKAAAAQRGTSRYGLFEESTCCCGPAFTLHEYTGQPEVEEEAGRYEPVPFPSRPEPMGIRHDGSSRDTYITAADIAGLIATLHEDDSEGIVDDTDTTSCC